MDKISIKSLAACLMTLAFTPSSQANMLAPDPSFINPVLNGPEQAFILNAGQPLGFQLSVSDAATLGFRPFTPATYTFEIALFDPITLQLISDSTPQTLFDSVGLGVAPNGLYNIIFASPFDIQGAFFFFDEQHSPTPLPPSLPLFVAGLGVLFLLNRRAKRQH